MHEIFKYFTDVWFFFLYFIISENFQTVYDVKVKLKKMKSFQVILEFVNTFAFGTATYFFVQLNFLML